jgi:hypothetical protein
VRALADGQSRSDHRDALDARRRLAEREAFEERAAIMEEGAKVNRATAERWARACLAKVPGARGSYDGE